VACPKCLREGQENKTALLARALAAESALAEARAALATAAAVLERAASMWPMVPGYEDRAREFGAAAEAAAKAAGGATPMRDALGALGTQIAFLRSCIRSGESLSPADNEQIDAALARAGGEVPAAGGVCADCGPFPKHPHTCALAAPGAGEQRQETPAAKRERYVCDNEQCEMTKMSACGLAVYGACTACGTGILRRANRAPAPTPKDPEEGR
jgi:hypothetical protein